VHLQQLLEVLRKHHQPALGPFTVADPKGALGELDVGDLEAREFGHLTGVSNNNRSPSPFRESA
jgi:hypothetical protein